MIKKPTANKFRTDVRLQNEPFDTGKLFLSVAQNAGDKRPTHAGDRDAVRLPWGKDRKPIPFAHGNEMRKPGLLDLLLR